MTAIWVWFDWSYFFPRCGSSTGRVDFKRNNFVSRRVKHCQVCNVDNNKTLTKKKKKHECMKQSPDVSFITSEKLPVTIEIFTMICIQNFRYLYYYNQSFSFYFPYESFINHLFKQRNTINYLRLKLQTWYRRINLFTCI